MNSDRIRNALREALREEADKIAADEDDAALILLFAGAEIRMSERLNGFSLDLKHDSKYYRLGREIADKITL